MKEYFRFQRSWTVTSDLLHRSLVIKTSSQFLSVLRHLHDANTHLTSARLKTSPILLLGLQSVSKSDSKSIARQLIFLLIFFFFLITWSLSYKTGFMQSSVLRRRVTNSSKSKLIFRLTLIILFQLRTSQKYFLS